MKKEHSADDVLTEYHFLCLDRKIEGMEKPTEANLMWAISEAARRREAYELRDTIGTLGMMIEDAIRL